MFSDAFQWHIPTPPEGEWLTVIVDLLRPLSKTGEVKLNSSNPLDQPNINLSFLSNDLDIMALREGVRFVDDILMNGDGFKDIIGEDYPWPMPRHSDEAMNKLILERSQTGFRESSLYLAIVLLRWDIIKEILTLCNRSMWHPPYL
jgi:choline dehydrogenase